MKSILKVKEDPSFGRDLSSGAIINLNSEAYDAHMRNKNQKTDLQNRINSLEGDIEDLKNIVSILLERSGK